MKDLYTKYKRALHKKNRNMHMYEYQYYNEQQVNNTVIVLDIYNIVY